MNSMKLNSNAANVYLMHLTKKEDLHEFEKYSKTSKNEYTVFGKFDFLRFNTVNCCMSEMLQVPNGSVSDGDAVVQSVSLFSFDDPSREENSFLVEDDFINGEDSY